VECRCVYNGSYAPVYVRIAVGVSTATENGGTGYLGFSTINNNVLAEHMRKSAIGYVDIGTKKTTDKLAVNGKIRAKEIKVEPESADFVFESDYTLRSLKETEVFFKMDDHLPEIPFAKEVEENGINLGEMNAKLLGKIEEQTLHIIDQNKRIEKLEVGKN
jgi:hypothetical protein